MLFQQKKSLLHDSSHLKLCKKLQEALSPFLYVKKIRKKEILLSDGETCKNIYFIREGMVKQYYISEGKEFIQNFFFEGNMACHFNSFLTQTESNSYLEALENTELWVLSYHNFQKISEAHPKFVQHLTICVSKMNNNRVSLLLLSDAKLRYQKFLYEEPEILQRVPQYMVASYLGMTPETLSRIRAKLQRKKSA